MKGTRSLISLLIVSALASIPYQGNAAESIKAYMGTAKPVNEAMAKFIEDELKIQIQHITLSFGELDARLKAEAPNFGADMVLPIGSPYVITAVKNGWTIPAPNLPAWKDVDPIYKDKDGHYYDLGDYSFVLIGNKIRLEQKGYGMPKSWKDLLDPKWKGEIVMPYPFTSGTAYMMVYTFLTLYGEEKGWQYLEALDKNIARYTKGGNEPTEVVGRGESLLGLTSDGALPSRLKGGYPLLWTVPAEGTGSEGNCVYILKGTKKYETAKTIVNFLGTEKAQRHWGEVSGFFPAKKIKDFKSPLYGEHKPKYIEIDRSWTVTEQDRILKTWKDKFLRK